MLRDNLELNSGLVKFRSKESAMAYMETLVQYYKTKQEEYGGQLSEHLRSAQGGASPQPKEKPDKEQKKDKGSQPTAGGWSKVGTLSVNGSDSRGALAQVTLRIVEDYKSKVEKVSEALKSFKDVDTLSQPGTMSYTLFMYKGVPEGVIVESLERKLEAFAFSASFRAV